MMQQTRGGLELRRLGRLTRGLHGRTQRTAVRAAVAEPLHRYDACGLQPAPDAWTATCQLILARPVSSDARVSGAEVLDLTLDMGPNWMTSWR